jgi:3-oxoacyl-[acyl-carrier-protein] synthase-1
VPPRISPLQISAFTATSAVGVGKEPLAEALAHSRSGLRANDFGDAPLPTWIGRVDGLEDIRLPEALASWDCRNNRLAWLGLHADGFPEAVAAARAKYGPSRIALILGTSTSSIGETELAYTQLDADGLFPQDQRRAAVHTPHSLAMFVQQVLGLTGPSETISTACSSSAKVFASAERLIRLGLADAAVVGEAAGFALVERVQDDAGAPLRLLGYGEASDAHHMSTPHPEGLGAERALDEALARAGLAPDAIDYINMHGTASQKNDEVEGALVARRFPATTHASSTKGFMGHTLGAAGIVESVISLLAIERGLMPGTVNTNELDTGFGPQIRLQPAHGEVRYALTNSFGFGGNNCSLVFGKAAP